MLNLNQKVIHRLYWKEKKSLPEIGNMYKVHHETIRRWMKFFNIPRRNRAEAVFLKKGIKIPLRKELYHLYWIKRKSTSQIAKELRVCKFTIRKWLKKYKIPIRDPAEGRRIYPRKPFSGDENEKAYLLGFCAGDVHVRKHRQTIEAITSSTHPAFIKLFNELFNKYGHCSKIPSRNKLTHQWKLRCGLDCSFEFLLNQKRIENSKLFLPFLAGYFDAEGYLKISKAYRCDRIALEFRISTKDLDLLEQIKQILKENDYNPTLRSEKNGMHCLGLYRRTEVLSLIEKLLPFSKHEEKIKKMSLILETQNERKWSKVKNKLNTLKFDTKKEVERCIQEAEIAWILFHPENDKKYGGLNEL